MLDTSRVVATTDYGLECLRFYSFFSVVWRGGGSQTELGSTQVCSKNEPLSESQMVSSQFGAKGPYAKGALRGSRSGGQGRLGFGFGFLSPTSDFLRSWQAHQHFRRDIPCADQLGQTFLPFGQRLVGITFLGEAG